MDIRNVLFGGSGLGSIVGRKVFGKGYSAIDRSNKSAEALNNTDAFGADGVHTARQAGNDEQTKNSCQQNRNILTGTELQHSYKIWKFRKLRSLLHGRIVF